MITQHVDMLTGSMGLEVENHVVTDASKAKTLLQGSNYDILHPGILAYMHTILIATTSISAVPQLTQHIVEHTHGATTADVHGT